MKTKRLWSTIVVSFICILLASSFVLQTSAETIETVASLQRATVVDVVIPEGYEGEQADHQHVTDLNVSENPLGFSGQFEKYSLQSYYGTGTRYPIAFSIDSYNYMYYDYSSNVVYGVAGDVETVFVSYNFDSNYSSVVLFENFYVTYERSSNSYYMKFYDYDGALLSRFSFASWQSGFGFSSGIFGSYYNDYYYFFLCWRTSTNAKFYSRCIVADDSFGYIGTYSVVLTTTSPRYCSSGCVMDGYYYPSGNDVPYKFNLTDLVWEDFTVENGFANCDNGFLCEYNDLLITFSSGNYFYYSDGIVSHSLPASFTVCTSESGCIRELSDSVVVPGSSSYLLLSDGNVQYYNMIDYSTDTTFVPDRYLNFSYLSASDGTANGGGYVGFELDFGVPDYFYENNEVTAFRFECMVGSYSNDSETFQGGIPPLTVDVVGGDNWLPILNGKMVKKVGYIYLWAFTCLIYTSNDGPITSLNITLNQYIPLQTETHSFSLPCSALTLERWEDTSSAIEDIKGDIVIIGNQIGQTNEKLDEIQNILTSLPDDHESNMQEWSNDLNNNQSRLDDISSAIEDEKSVYDDLVSEYDPYISAPDIDPSIENNASEMIDKVTSLDSGEAADLFSFIRDLWTVHPYMLGMSSIVVVLGVLGIYVRSA